MSVQENKYVCGPPLSCMFRWKCSLHTCTTVTHSSLHEQMSCQCSQTSTSLSDQSLWNLWGFHWTEQDSIIFHAPCRRKANEYHTKPCMQLKNVSLTMRWICREEKQTKKLLKSALIKEWCRDRPANPCNRSYKFEKHSETANKW